MKLRFVVICALAGLSGAVFAASGDELIAAHKCGKCHTATTTKKAPSFASVATKYKGDAAAPDKLAQFLKTGGAGDHDVIAASDAELKAMVATVLSTK